MKLLKVLADDEDDEVKVPAKNVRNADDVLQYLQDSGDVELKFQVHFLQHHSIPHSESVSLFRC